MKRLQSLSKLRVGLVVVVMAVAGLGLMRFASAASQLKLLPNANSVQNGSNIAVAVRINPDEPVDAVETTVTYDQSKLEFVSIDTAGSAFPTEIVQGGGGGTVDITRGHLTGTVSGDALVAIVTFKAKVGSGTTNIQISGNATSANNPGTYINPTFENASITLTTPTSSGGGSQPSNPSGGGSGSGGGGGSSGGGRPGRPGSNQGSGSQGGSSKEQAKQRREIGLQIHKKQVEFTRVILKATAKEKVKVHVVYGLDPKQLAISTAQTDFGKEHEIHLDSAILVPGTRFYFKAIAEDEDGNKVETNVENLKTKGFRVRLRVTDAEEKPIKNQKVTLHSEPITAETDENGVATFDDVAPGDHRLEYEQSGQVHSKTVSVGGDEPLKTESDGTQKAEPEDIQVVFNKVQFADTDNSPIILPATIATILALLAGAALLVYKRRQNRFNPISDTGFDQPSANTPIDSQPQDNDQLINKVKGLDRPDPGSVVSPKSEDKDER